MDIQRDRWRQRQKGKTDRRMDRGTSDSKTDRDRQQQTGRNGQRQQAGRQTVRNGQKEGEWSRQIQTDGQREIQDILGYRFFLISYSKRVKFRAVNVS